MKTPFRFRFRPIHFNWVAIHPKPIGVIYFIGGAFFGTFPTIFYRYFLRNLFNQGYTIVAMPFRFTFRHWPVAIGLASELDELRKAILAEAKHLGYEYDLYEEDPTLAKGQYSWLAHSVGSKYIALLEVLSDLEGNDIQTVLGDCVGSKQYQQIQNSLRGVDLHVISLKNQPSLLLAPVITGIESAIPIRLLAELLQKLGLDVQPTTEETYCLIEGSRLFNLTAVIAFGKDRVAQKAGTVQWLQTHLADRLVRFVELPGRRHLAPLGFMSGDRQLVDETLETLTILKQAIAEEGRTVAPKAMTAII